MAAALPAEADIRKHEDIAEQHDQRQLPVEDEDQRQRAHDLNEALHHHRKAVIEGVRDRIHIVGETTHRITVRIGVKVTQRERLHTVKQILADLTDDLLRDHHHDLRVAIGRKHTGAVDAGSERHRVDQPVHIAGDDVVIDDRLEHVCAQQVGQRAQRDEHGHGQQQETVIAHVMQQRAQRLPEILRALSDRLSHFRSPPSAATHTAPDRPGCWPAARCACRMP